MVAPAPASVPPPLRRPSPQARPPTAARAGAAAFGAMGPSPAPRGAPGSVVAAWACCMLGLVALAWVPASLWPGAGLPAWPAVSLGLVAVLVSWGRGGALLRAIGGIAGLVAATVGSAQIAVLWMAAWFVSYM